MYRQTRPRPSVARIIGLVLVAAAYAATLVWAGNLVAGEPVDVVTGSGATAALSAPLVAASSTGGVAAAGVAAAGYGAVAATEAPLATLAIAFALVALGAGWYAASRLRGRHPLARRARLVVRYLTALV